MSNSVPTLRVTIRCLVDDLGIDRSYASKDVGDFNHEVCRAFESKRSQSPIGAEKLQPITTDAEVYTLHAGRWRGATWHDQNHDAIWLLGCGYHRSGQKGEVYPYLKDLDSKGALFPTADDYELLFEVQDITFAQALIDEVPRLIERAHERPAEEVAVIIAGRIRVSVVIEIAEEVEALWVAVSLKLLPGEMEIPAEWMPLLLAAFFRDVSSPLELQTAEQLPTRLARSDEMVFVDYRG